MAGKRDKKALNDQKLQNALLKKALGYDAKEVVEEYVSDDGEIRLSKKKVTVKNVPPDVTAIKMLIDEREVDLTTLSDQELESEKIRLFSILEQLKKDGGKENKEKQIEKPEQSG